MGELIYFISAFLVFAGIAIIFIYKIASLKTQNTLLIENNLASNQQNEILQKENIQHLQTIERLTVNQEQLKQIIEETEKARKESFSDAKSALFELGSQLSKELISEHKRETEEMRVASAKNSEAAQVKFHNEFERLVTMVGVLHKEVSQSTEIVGFIKQSLLSPTSSGMLAEITLENILKSSGLRNKLDFSIQYNVNNAEQVKLRPDAVIFLPGNNLMVIDAKASQFLFKQGTSEFLAKTMNNHLKSLNNKDYAEHIITSFQHKGVKFNNIITLMFLPTEHAVEKIIEADPSFLERAWSANIFPVGPAGLMNMLSFAKFQIADQMRAENHQLILDEVRKLLLSIATITEHSQKLGNNIQSIVSNYDKFAGSFNRHLLSRAKQLQKLGVDTGNKNIPSLLERYQLVSSKSELLETDNILLEQ